MAYSKTNFANNTTPPISAENLNKMDQGIYEHDNAISKGYIGINQASPQIIKGVTGVMQYCAGVLQDKKCVLQTDIQLQ